MKFKTIDFLRPEPKPLLGKWLLASAVLALASVAAVDREWTIERQQIEQAAQARVEAIRARLRTRQPQVLAPVDLRLQNAQSELRRPWLPSLRAIESAAVDPVYLLSIAFDPASGRIQLDGEAPSFEHALAFTQVLADGVAVSSVVLESHEEVKDAATGQERMRFKAVAQWRMP